jgi:hypothetical protein
MLSIWLLPVVAVQVPTLAVAVVLADTVQAYSR